ncbi:MAG: L-rhamnonate dehydratase [Gammaproteobacteria bacterium]
MRIKEIRATVYRWRGKTVPPQSHFCTNPMDILAGVGESGDTMASFRFHEWLVVEVECDNGLVGIGNAALAPTIAQKIVQQYLAPLVIGGDPWDYELLWQRMYRSTMAWGRKGIAMAAISAVDIAMWDILGKATGQPVFKLLGGRLKNRIPVYASKLYSQPLEKLAAEAESYLQQGFQAMKMRFGWGPADGSQGMQRNVELVKAVRETVGHDIGIMAEAYMGWTFEYARRMLPLLAPYNLQWLEEPVIPDHINNYADLRKIGGVPIAGGEHEFTLHGFQQLLEAGAVDVIQYDTNRVGGITAARKINALATAYGIPVVPHAGQMHNYHLVMSELNCPMAEYFPVHGVEIGNELFYYLFDGDPEPQDGFLDLADNIPGLGVTVSSKQIAQFEILAP